MRNALCAICIALVSATCAGRDASMRRETTAIRPDSLVNFFRVCEQDSKNAIAVIVNRDITKNLTHLQRMDGGGRKYYLLEREAITEMIRAVTSGLYDDFILINRHGVVVYTMADDALFAKSVPASFKGTALQECFEKTGTDLYLSDTGPSPGASERPVLYAAGRVVRDGEFHGVFLLQVRAERIARLIAENESIVSRAGIVRISRNGIPVDAPYPDFERIAPATLVEARSHRLTLPRAVLSYYPFTYKNLSWIIIARER